MKQIYILFLALAPLCASSQTPGKIAVAMGKKISLVSTSQSETDMGMGMSMTSNTTNYYSVEVLQMDDETITLKNILTRLTLDMDGMGQQNSYDSDKPADRDSEMGKSLPAKSFEPDTLQLDRRTIAFKNRQAKTDQKKDQEENPMSGMMQAFGNADPSAIIRDAFFIIPANIKIGDQWKDSSIEKNLKRNRTYSLDSLTNGRAVIGLVENTQLNTESEVQGMAMQVSMTGSTKGRIVMDTNAGLILQKELVADITGSIEVMGQSSPISSKSTTKVSLSFQ